MHVLAVMQKSLQSLEQFVVAYRARRVVVVGVLFESLQSLESLIVAESAHYRGRHVLVISMLLESPLSLESLAAEDTFGRRADNASDFSRRAHLFLHVVHRSYKRRYLRTA